MSPLELSLLAAGCVTGIGCYALYLRPRRITTYALVFLAVLLDIWAMIRPHLMYLAVAVQRGTIYSILISLIVAVYIALLISLSNVFDADMGVAAPLSAGVVTLIGIGTIPRIERFFQKVTDRIFFKDQYDHGTALEELSNILNDHIKLTDLAPSLIDALIRVFKPTDVEFIHITTGTTFTSKTRQQTFTESPLPLAKNGTRIAIIARGRSIGLFTFGPKRSGDPYTGEDLRLLRIFASQAAVAFEKTQLYEHLEVYSKSLEEKVIERTKSLAALQKHQRELFDDISHALQTPLTVLKSSVESIKLIQTTSETSMIELTERSVDNLSRLIRGLLQLAHIDAIPEEECVIPIQVSILIEDVIEYVEIVCQEKDIHVTKSIESNLVMLGNEKQIEEVITNILSNAVHYTVECPKREIAIEATAQDGEIIITISDTGIGIGEDQLSLIFDRFYRGGQSNTPGHGLGLAITKRIVDKHHGRIDVTSTLGVGTIFTVLFPSLREYESLQ